jgi:HAD superfamily hydrolase (TIGR01490 family)
MKLAIYDFDGTLSNKETIPFLVEFYRKNNYSYTKLGKFYLKMIGLTVKYKLKVDSSLDKEKYRETATNTFMYLFEDMNKSEIVKFFSDSTAELVEYFNPKVVESIRYRKEQGYHIVLCSGANTLLLREVTKYVDFDAVIGTELHFLEDGSYDFNSHMSVTTGKNKPIAVLERFKDKEVDWQNSCAYGDSYYDYDVLNLTGNPIAVTPDKSLRDIAMEKGWEILGEK